MIIAELAKVHGGDIIVAERLIKSCANLGFDAVKLQAYDIYDISDNCKMAEKYKKCHLNLQQIDHLKKYAYDLGLHLWCSVFSPKLIQPLSEMFSTVKIASTFLSSESFVKECIEKFPIVHIATGMHTVNEVKRSIVKYNNCIFYHCTSLYPTPHGLERLSRIRDLGLQGFSYHGRSINSVLYAMLLGAKYVELHYNPAAEDWQWSDRDVMLLLSKMEVMHKSLKDSELIEEEIENKNYYSKEFKELYASYGV